MPGGRVWWNYGNNQGMEEVTTMRHTPEGRGMMGVAFPVSLALTLGFPFTQLS